MIVILRNEATKDLIKEEMKKERPKSDRPKMPLSQRAKQFAPFDSLTGLMERLAQAEEEHRQAITGEADKGQGSC